MLDIASIKELEMGLMIGRLLRLPDDLTFDSSNLCDLLATKTYVRPFKVIM